jgi:hypothetical protein
VIPAWRDEGGIRRTTGALPVPPGGPSAREDWRGANAAKTEKLLRARLQRNARGRGLQLRHSAHGYSLVDTAQARVEGRGDMTLAEVESWLERG